MKKFSMGRTIGGAALGVLAGLLMPASMPLAAFCLATPIAVSVLFAYAGLIPAVSASLCSALSLFFWGGEALLWPGMAALIAPGWLYIVLLNRRVPFFQGAKWAIAGQLGLLLLAVFLIWLRVRANLVEALVSSMRGVAEQFPGFLIDPMLISLGRAGFFGASSGADFLNDSLSAAQRKDLIEGMLSWITTSFTLGLPSMMLNSGIVTALFGLALPSRICARRGDEPPVSLPPMRNWRLTKDMIIGPPVCALLCMILHTAGMAGADSAYVAMLNLAYLLFSIQALGAIDRRMHKGGFSAGRRALSLIVLTLFGQLILRVVGVYSALFGSCGLISTFVRKRAERNDKGGDEP